MKKLTRVFAVSSLALGLAFGGATVVPVCASNGPQGQQDTRSGNPSGSSEMTQEEYEYLLWFILMWLLGWW